MPEFETREDDPDAWPEAAPPRDAAAELVEMPYQRLTQRRPPPPDRRSLWMLLAVVVLVHLLIGWFAYIVLRPALQRRLAQGVFAVNLIEPANDLPPPPPLLPPPPLPGAPPAPAVHYEAPLRNATKATMEGTPPPRLRLFGANGQVLIVAPTTSTPPAPAYKEAGLPSSHIYNGKPLPYHPNPLNKAWAPLNESLGQKTIGRALDKAIDKTTVKKVVHLPGGIKIQCAVSPLMLLGGCSGMPPQPPPPNDNDIRLSLPPARTLTGKKVPLPASAASVAPDASR